MKDAWYLRRLENGLFNLQTVDYIMAFLAMEDDGVGHTRLLRVHHALKLYYYNSSGRTSRRC
jgi:hypothetical protein